MSIVDEARRYESQRARIEKCRISTVQPVNCIVLNSTSHAGIVTHICGRRAEHVDRCICACGYKWKGKK